MLKLYLFGSLGVAWQIAESTLEPIPLTARPGSLLAYLALARGQFFSRAELIAALWGERQEPGHVGTFNTALWRLRKAVERAPLRPGELIACDGHGAVGIPHDARLVLDTEQFERLVVPALAKPIERIEPADVESLKAGVARYTDDALAGFSDEWALREREKLRRHHLNALGRLMQLSALARDYAGAIDYARQVLDRDILREDIHCELMRLLVLNGQRALALRQFERCRDALRRELAIQPMRETMALYHQIAEHAVGHDEPAALHATEPSLPTFAAMQPPRAASELITSAREHLALADAQLQRSLPLVTPPSHDPRSA